MNKKMVIGIVAAVGAISGIVAMIMKVNRRKNYISQVENDAFDEDEFDWDFDDSEDDDIDEDYDDEYWEEECTDPELEQVTKLINASRDVIEVAREIIDRREEELHEFGDC